MSGNTLRRWCSPTMVLVVTRPSDDPAQVLFAIRHAAISGAKVVLVRLRFESCNTARLECSCGSGPRLEHAHEIGSGTDSGRASMWEEIARRSFMLKNILLDEVPSIVKAFQIDRVLVTAARSLGHLHRTVVEQRLISAVSVPLWILGRGMALNLGEPDRPSRILLPISFSPELEFDLRFACELAKSHDASLSVLHVFRKSSAETSVDERSPFAVKARLPLASLRAANVGWPFQIAIRQGDPATQIIEFNERRPHDLVILRAATHLRDKSSSGSTMVSRICSEIQCPVAILGSSIEAPHQNAGVINIAAHRNRFSRKPLPAAMER